MNPNDRYLTLEEYTNIVHTDEATRGKDFLEADIFITHRYYVNIKDKQTSLTSEVPLSYRLRRIYDEYCDTDAIRRAVVKGGVTPIPIRPGVECIIRKDRIDAFKTRKPHGFCHSSRCTQHINDGIAVYTPNRIYEEIKRYCAKCLALEILLKMRYTSKRALAWFGRGNEPPDPSDENVPIYLATPMYCSKFGIVNVTPDTNGRITYEYDAVPVTVENPEKLLSKIRSSITGPVGVRDVDGVGVGCVGVGEANTANFNSNELAFYDDEEETLLKVYRVNGTMIQEGYYLIQFHLDTKKCIETAYNTCCAPPNPKRYTDYICGIGGLSWEEYDDNKCVINVSNLCMSCTMRNSKVLDDR